MKISLGLIEGRHPMPIDRYLLPADITNRAGFHEGVYQAAREAAKEFSPRDEVTLYLTGLTPAAIGAVLGFIDAGVVLTLASFDSESKQYVLFTP